MEEAEDEEADHEIKIAEQEEVRKRKELLSKAINVLNDREQDIIHYRKLSETPKLVLISISIVEKVK